MGVAACPRVVRLGDAFLSCRGCYPTTHPVQALLGFSAALAPKLTHIFANERCVIAELCSLCLKSFRILWSFLKLLRDVHAALAASLRSRILFVRKVLELCRAFWGV